MPVVVGAALRPIAGETVCGDSFAVVHLAGRTVICLADGLGHGAAANAASDAACRHVLAHAESPLDTLMRGIDAALRGLRGAAVSLLSLQPARGEGSPGAPLGRIDAGRVQFTGIGNVDVRALSRAPISPPTRAGIVGQGVRAVRVWEYPLAAGDLVVLVSDGVSSRFDLADVGHLEPQAIADALLAAHAKDHDDACCVVARVGAG